MFTKYYVYDGQARIARAPDDLQVVRKTVNALSRQKDQSALTQYPLDLIDAWETGCRSDCVGTCSCPPRVYPYQRPVTSAS